MLVKFLQIFLLVFLFNQSLYPQTGDSTLSAVFVYGDAELDSFVVDNFVRPKFCLEKGVDMDIWMQFTVDSLSGVSFVRVMDIQSAHDNWSDAYKEKINKLKPELKKEAIRVIKATEGLWIPKELNGKPTWEVIDYRIEMRVPEFYSNAGEYQKWGMNPSMVQYSPVPDTPANNPVKYYNLGVKKMNQKKHYIAIKYFEKSIKLGNNTKDVYYNYGVALYLHGLKEDACKAWDKAVKLGDVEAQGLIDKNCK